MTARKWLTFGIAALFAAAPAEAAKAPRTAAAVVAADDAWGTAEVAGDVAFVERLLLPGYRSIGVDGKVTSREAIVASVRRRGGRSEALAAQVAAWKAAHPTKPEVRIYDDMAVLTWMLAGANGTTAVSSCDVFVYRAGRWLAVYSQHSIASG